MCADQSKHAGTIRAWKDSKWFEEFVQPLLCKAPAPKDEEDDVKADHGGAAPGDGGALDCERAAGLVYAHTFTADCIDESIWTSYENDNSVYAQYMQMCIHFILQKGTFCVCRYARSTLH